jgi:hypothetical protein
MNTKNILFCSTLITILFLNSLCAQWPTTIDESLEINSRANRPLLVVEDRHGGAFIVYGSEDLSTSYPSQPINELWFTRVNNMGETIITPIRIGTDSIWLEAESFTWSGDNNLLIGILNNTIDTWDGGRPRYHSNLVIQKIDTLGNELWNNGIDVFPDTLENLNFDLIIDSKGGCFVSANSVDEDTFLWSGYKSVQYINENGEIMWGDSGKVLYSGEFNDNDWANQYKIHRFDNNIVAVHEFKRGIYEKVEAINSSGETLWTLPARENYKYVHAISNKEGQFTIFYEKISDDYLSLEYSFDRINKSGKYLFSNPLPFVDSCARNSEITHMYKVSDNQLNVLWMERIKYDTEGIYIQSIDTLNNLLQHVRGESIIPPGYYPLQILKNENEIIILANNDSTQILQKVTDGNNLPWGDIGVTFFNDDNLCFNRSQIISDNFNGAIVFWNECLFGTRAKQVSENGELGIITSVSNQSEKIHFDFQLSEAYPNPFNPSTSIDYHVNSKCNLEIKIYSPLGELVSESFHPIQKPGKYSYKFEGKNLSSGVYYVRFDFSFLEFSKNNSIIKTKKILLLK